MIELKKQFTKKETDFNQIYKDNDVVIYKLTRNNADGDGMYTWFEVFKRKVKPQDIYHEDEFEKYPSDEAFGNWAWSCSNVECVKKVLNNYFKECEHTFKIIKLLNRM